MNCQSFSQTALQDSKIDLTSSLPSFTQNRQHLVYSACSLSCAVTSCSLMDIGENNPRTIQYVMQERRDFVYSGSVTISQKIPRDSLQLSGYAFGNALVSITEVKVGGCVAAERATFSFEE